MALRGTGSATSGWTRPALLTRAANLPIVTAGWVYAASGTSTSWFGVGGSNAMVNAFCAGGNLYWDFWDDTGANPGAPFYPFNPDNKWHHIAIAVIDGTTTRMWHDGVEKIQDNATIFTNFGSAVGSQTFTNLNFGLRPTDAGSPAFDTTAALAEVVLFTGGAENAYAAQIAALAAGQNPRTVLPLGRIRAYYPLRGNLQDQGPEHLGLTAQGSPGDPVWSPVGHPQVDPLPRMRRVLLSHTAAVLAGSGSSADAATSAFSTAIPISGSGTSSDSAIALLLASSLQSSTTLSRDSAIGALRSATALVGVGTAAFSGFAALTGTGIPVVGTSTSSDAAVGSLTVPSISAAAQQLSNALVDTLLRGQPLLAPTTWYVALITQFGDTVTPGLEVSGSSYSRGAIPATLAAWSGTQGPGGTIPSNGIAGLVSNNVAVAFPQSAENWGTIVGYELWDAPVGGNRWMAGKFATPVTIVTGQTRSIPIAALSVSIG